MTETPAVKTADGDEELTTSEVDAVTDNAATEGDGNDAVVEAVVGESAETAETAQMAETADMAATTDVAGPEAPISEGEAEIQRRRASQTSPLARNRGLWEQMYGRKHSYNRESPDLRCMRM